MQKNNPLSTLKVFINSKGLEKTRYTINGVTFYSIGTLQEMKYSELLKYKRSIQRKVDNILDEIVSWYFGLIDYFTELKYQKVFGFVSSTNDNSLPQEQLLLLDRISKEEEFNLLQYFPSKQ